MNGLLGWYRNGTSQERKTFWACFSGWALDSYDIQMFAFLVPTLITVLHLTKADAGMLATGALLSSAIGGWIAGILSDRFGRVRILIGTIIWFTAFGVLAGFAQSYSQLLALRTIQGIGFGGEWAVGAALMAEVIRPENRGKAMGLVQSGYSLGWALAATGTTLIVAALPADLAWRVVFWSSILPAGLVLFIRRHIQEAPVFERARVAATGSEKASIYSAFRPEIIRSTILSSIVVAGLQSSSYAFVSWVPTLLVQSRGLAPGSVIAATLLISAGAFVGFVTTSYLSDLIGRRISLILLSVCAMVVTLLYTLVVTDAWVLLALGFPIGFTVNGMFAAVGPLLSELFPTRYRATCMGFSYNFGKAVGALVVTFVGAVAAHLSLGTAMGIFCFAGFAVAILALLLIPETRGTDFEEEADRSSAPFSARQQH